MDKHDELAAAGKRGSQANRTKCSHEHFVEIGRKGGAAVKERHGMGYYTALGQSIIRASARKGAAPPRHPGCPRGPRDE
jgi:general stress protein YciG